jgi:hypothetical protein
MPKKVVRSRNRSSPGVGANERSWYWRRLNCMDEPVSAVALWTPNRDLHGPRKGDPERNGHQAPPMGTRQRAFRFFEATAGHIPVSVHVSHPCFRRLRESRCSIDTTRAAAAWIGRHLGLTARRALPILCPDGMNATMRRFTWILVVALGASLTVSGCGNRGRVSTSELQSSFKSAEPAMQTLVDKAVAAVNSNNYPEALNDLQTLSHKARLTLDQERVLKDTIAAIEKKTSSMTNKPAAEPPPKIPAGLEKILGRPQ